MIKKNNYTFWSYIEEKFQINQERLFNIFILILVILFYLLINKNYKFYIFSTNIIFLGVIIGFVNINVIKNKIVSKELKNFNRFYLISAMLALIIGVIILSILNDNKISYIYILLSFQSILECYQIENIFNLKNKHIRNTIVHICCLLMFTLFIFISDKNTILNLFFNKKYLNCYTIISISISLCIAISTLNKILSNQNRLSMNEFKKITFYIYSIILNFFSFIFIEINFHIILVILLTMKCITFIRFYNYVVEKIYDESLDIINCDIESAIKTKKQLTSKLIKRNKILNDTNIMVYKAQYNYNMLLDSIYGGVFLFVDNRVKYVNNNILNKLHKESSEFINMDINEFLNKYCNVALEDIEKDKNYVFDVDIEDKNIKLGAFLICPNSQNKLLYIEDFRGQNEDIKLKKEFEEYLADDKQKKEFFANISHELKTPINLIYSAIQLNSLYIKKNNIEAVDRNRKIISQNCLRLIRTINNFIDSNKISEGYIVPEIKLYNIVEIIENTVLACNKYVKLADNRLIFDSQEEEIYVNCDKDMIIRIILNILSNSVKYGKKGGIIKVNLFVEDNNVYIKIKNDGAKIEKEIAPYIFDKFTKLNKAFNRIKEGSGLGLFLTKALVEIQGGNISLVSSNKGNEFIINMERIISTDEKNACTDDLEINTIEEKVDIEFSDIYI